MEIQASRTPGLTLSHKNGNTKISSPDVEEGALAEAPFSIAPLANECRTSPGNKELVAPGRTGVAVPFFAFFPVFPR